jgi:geranylgeranyl diphosphate synthase type II
MSFDLKTYLKSRRSIIERTLKDILKNTPTSVTLVDSMNYSLMSGGKRLRPILALSSWEMLTGIQSPTDDDYQKILPFACAMEMIHTYSLIHDDLPAMDNDDLRRGSPTNHKVYGDAVAILAGDALLTEAFVVLTKLSKYYDSSNVVSTITYVGNASGMNGMVGGQVLDIENDARKPTKIDEKYLCKTSMNKTGAIITASVVGPAILMGMLSEMKELEGYSQGIGLAFQIIDDILGATATKDELGKTPNIDVDNKKQTFVDVLGLDGARKRAKVEIDQAKAKLDKYGDKAAALKAIADYFISRTN